MAGPPTLERILEHYGVTEADVNKQISDVHLEEISRVACQGWRLLPARLEIEHIEVSNIERDHRLEEEKRLAFLQKWKGQHTFEATYKALMNALISIKHVQDAESVCKTLKTYPPPVNTPAPPSTNQPSIPSTNPGLPANQPSSKLDERPTIATQPRSKLDERPTIATQPRSKLDERPTIATALKALLSTADEWKMIGALLEVETADLNSIQKNTAKDNDALLEMITEWLKMPGATWKSLIEAVKVVNKQKAMEIEQNL